MTKNSFIYRLMSVAFIVFIFFGSVSATLKYISPSVVDNSNLSVIEKFFATANSPSDIIANVMSGKTQNNNSCSNTQNKKSNDFSFIDDKIFAVAIIAFSVTASFINSNVLVFKDFVPYTDGEFSYPLKIPFWRCIYFLLLFKILFNVLPRSISVNLYKNTVRSLHFVQS